MSLNVYLLQHQLVPLEGRTGIYLREGGATREVTREEWDARFPGTEPVVFLREGEEVFSRNITHNLGKMAETAGLYSYLWRPEEAGITKARELIRPLMVGLHCLKSDPDHFRTFNPSNGWGSYEDLVEFVEAYLAACKEYPEAEVTVSR